MSARTTARLAWLVCGATLTVLASVLLLIILGWSTPLPRGRPPWQDQALSLAGVVGAPLLGGLIASRRPRNPYGWLWLVFGLGLALQLLGESYAAYALVVEPLPAAQTAPELLAAGGPLALGCGTFLFLLFPTGRLPSRRWRPLSWIAGISGAVLFALHLLFDSPDEGAGTVTLVVFAAVLALFASIVLSALSLIVRYRRAGGVERQQLKWLALAAVLTVSYVVGELLGLDRLVGGTWWSLLDAATNTAVYAAVGIAILRHRLYDIDLIINRALVYGPLTALLALVYVGGVVGLQAAFRSLSGQESTLAVVASTLTIAALFGPLRRRAQALVDRRFYRRKYDAARTLADFNARLRDETDLGTLGRDLVGVASATVQPEHVSLWLRPVAARKTGRPG